MNKVIRKRIIVLTMVLLIALGGFEMFNYGTSEMALKDVFGDTKTLGFRWAFLLAACMSLVDLGGLARLITPGGQKLIDEDPEVKLIMIAWLMACIGNAFLTFWAVSLSIMDNPDSSFYGETGFVSVVPGAIVAIIVFAFRMLLITALSQSLDHIVEGLRKGYPVETTRSNAKKKTGYKNRGGPVQRKTNPTREGILARLTDRNYEDEFTL